MTALTLSRHLLGAMALFISVTLYHQAQAGEAARLDAGGVEVPVYWSGPVNAASAILIIHDWFGVTDMTRDAADRLGRLGHRVLVVDLYGGVSADNHADAFRLMQSTTPTQSRYKLDAAMAALNGDDRRVALFGFSMGASYVFDFAIERPNAFEALAIWYGETPADPARLELIAGTEMLAVLGSKDGAAADQAAAFSKAADSAGASAEVFVYPGVGHAFAQPLFNEGRNWDEEATEVAWVLTENFFARKLK